MHLGQLLTYAAGTHPTTIVWIAAAFRPEHRAALDWLNERTDENTRFFGVQLGVVRIDDSPPAPSFKLVAEPNDWEKTVRAATNQAEARSEKQELYRAFWSRWLERIRADRPSWSRATRPPADSWFTTSTGVSGATFYTAWTRRGLSSELVFESRDPVINTARLQALRVRRAEAEAAYGRDLDWQELPGRKATRIADYLPDADIAAVDEWDRYVDWLLEHQTRLRNALVAAGGVPEVEPSSLPVP
jgi:hypothetical protein